MHLILFITSLNIIYLNVIIQNAFILPYRHFTINYYIFKIKLNQLLAAR